MNEKLERRLADLKAEYETGQKMLAELDAKRQNLSSTLLRIEGAITVIREVLEGPGGETKPTLPAS